MLGYEVCNCSFNTPILETLHESDSLVKRGKLCHFIWSLLPFFFLLSLSLEILTNIFENATFPAKHPSEHNILFCLKESQVEAEVQAILAAALRDNHLSFIWCMYTCEHTHTSCKHSGGAYPPEERTSMSFTQKDRICDLSCPLSPLLLMSLH